jgi:hypothetical protein
MLILVAVLAIILISTALRFCAHMRTLSAGKGRQVVEISSNQYRPMLRLLADEDFDVAPRDAAVRRMLRAQRRQLFREYLRYLSKDYGQLLAGIRLAMVQSEIDRPDLAKALLKNRVLFSAALCRIDVRLGLHALGIGGIDASKLVDALDILRTRASVLGQVMSPVTSH